MTGDSLAAVVAQRAVDIAAATDIDLPEELQLWAVAGGRPSPSSSPVPGAPDDLGALLEAQLDAGRRRTLGAHYTPREIAEGLVARALCGRSQATVGDPACGGGALLLAAARCMAEGGDHPATIVTRLWGADVDPLAAATAEAAVALWAGVAPPPGRFVVADALVDPLPWPALDVVVGNPPFLSQLDERTVRSAERDATLRARFGSVLRAYTDTASLFLLLGCDLVRSGGTVAMLQPQSVVAARDTAAVRDAVDQRAVLREVWVPVAHAFTAAVDVCAPVLDLRGPVPASLPTESAAPAAAPGVGSRVVSSAPGVVGALVSSASAAAGGVVADGGVVPSESAAPAAAPGVDSRLVRLGSGAGSAPSVARTASAPASSAGSWSSHLARHHGVPLVRLRGGPTIGEEAEVTAAFRDEYYGLAAAVHERNDHPDGRPLVTTGLVDMGSCAWGERPARIARRSWSAPVVDSGALTGRAAAWVARTTAPKLVVATQTQVVEVAVDEEGTWVAGVPLIVVLAPAERLWPLAAALSAPPVAAWVAERTAGTAMTAGALKLTAALVREVPLPVDEQAWSAGADALRAGDLEACAEAMTRAYGCDEEVLRWWRARAKLTWPEVRSVR